MVSERHIRFSRLQRVRHFSSDAAKVGQDHVAPLEDDATLGQGELRTGREWILHEHIGLPRHEGQMLSDNDYLTQRTTFAAFWTKIKKADTRIILDRRAAAKFVKWRDKKMSRPPVDTSYYPATRGLQTIDAVHVRGVLAIATRGVSSASLVLKPSGGFRDKSVVWKEVETIVKYKRLHGSQLNQVIKRAMLHEKDALQKSKRKALSEAADRKILDMFHNFGRDVALFRKKLLELRFEDLPSWRLTIIHVVHWDGTRRSSKDILWAVRFYSSEGVAIPVIFS